MSDSDSAPSADLDVLGIQLSREIKLSLQWPEFAANLAEAAAKFWIQGPAEAAVSGISAIAKLVSSAQVERSPGEVAWEVGVLSFAWALDQVKTSGDVDVEVLRVLVKESINAAKYEAEVSGLLVPVTFLERPTTLPLYVILRDRVLRQSPDFLLSKASPESIRFRLDAAYERAVFAVWTQRYDTYRALAHALSSPGREAAESSLGWTAYRKRLIHEFDVKAVFGQDDSKVSLSQLYVPLRGYWRKPEHEQKHPGESDLPRYHDVAVLDQLLEDWVTTGKESD